MQPWQNHEHSGHRLWQQTIGGIWPLSQTDFGSIVGGEETLGFIEYSRSQPIGACLAKYGDKRGQILLLMVAPEHQRQGLGSELFQSTAGELARVGVEEIHLGSGVGAYFWPGIPTNLPAAVAFWQKHGFTIKETSWDMIASLDSLAPHLSEATRNRAPASAAIHPARSSQADQIAAFATVHFPDWLPYYEQAAAAGAEERILIAEWKGEIVGAALVSLDDCLWQPLFSGPVGSAAALGVAEWARRRGIGLALAAEAAAWLKRGGMAYAYLGWTWLLQWYGQLGWRPWRAYKMVYPLYCQSVA